MRDSGPTFVTSDQGLGGVDWVFNGWGDHTAFDWRQDAKVASHIIELTGAKRLGSDLVNEGGGIHVNGDGDVLLTRTVSSIPVETRRQPRTLWKQGPSKIGTSVPSGLTAVCGGLSGPWHARTRRYDRNLCP